MNSLKDVNVKTVTLKELVEFIDALRGEFPVAIRVLAKRLIAQEYGMKPSDIEFDFPQQFDDAAIIESLHNLEGDMKQQVTGQFVLSLHKTFGFGKVRALRVWEKVQEEYKGQRPSVEELFAWCEKRGIDYDTTFGVPTTKRYDHLDAVTYALQSGSAFMREAASGKAID